MCQTVLDILTVGRTSRTSTRDDSTFPCTFTDIFVLCVFFYISAYLCSLCMPRFTCLHVTKVACCCMYSPHFCRELLNISKNYHEQLCSVCAVWRTGTHLAIIAQLYGKTRVKCTIEKTAPCVYTVFLRVCSKPVHFYRVLPCKMRIPRSC